MRTLVLVAVLLSQASCSLLFMERVDDSWHPRREPRCTESVGFAVWDMALAVANVAAGVALYAHTTRQAELDIIEQGQANTQVAFAVSGMVLGALYATSGGYGLHQSDRCTEARDRRDDWLAGERQWRRDRERRPPPRAAPPRPAPAAAPRVEPVTPPADAGAPEPGPDAGPPQ